MTSSTNNTNAFTLTDIEIETLKSVGYIGGEVNDIKDTLKWLKDIFENGAWKAYWEKGLTNAGSELEVKLLNAYFKNKQDDLNNIYNNDLENLNLSGTKKSRFKNLMKDPDKNQELVFKMVSVEIAKDQKRDYTEAKIKALAQAKPLRQKEVKESEDWTRRMDIANKPIPEGRGHRAARNSTIFSKTKKVGKAAIPNKAKGLKKFDPSDIRPPVGGGKRRR